MILIIGMSDVSVSLRLSQMQTARGDFENAWQRANDIYNVYLVDDGNIHSPEAKIVVDFLTDEILKAFNGDIDLTPSLMNYSKANKKALATLSRVYNQENKKINVQLERKKAVKNMLRYRFGVVFEGYFRASDVDSFDGLITESVDPRHFFDDESSSKFYDPTGFDGSRDCIRRRPMSTQSFKDMYLNDGFDKKKVQEVLDAAGAGADVDLNMKGKLDDETTGIINVLEYWSNDEVIFHAMGKDFYKAENPYGRLPFVVYVRDSEQETKYPPSLIEVMAPLLQMEDLMLNLTYEQEKLNIPYILADAASGLVDGQQLEAGVINTIENQTQGDIRQMVQEVRVGGATPNAYNLINLIEDRKRNVAKIDTRSLRDRPDETLGHAKIKQSMQAKEIINQIESMMIGAEQQRAALRLSNIIQYLFSEERDVLVHDVAETSDDLVQKKGSSSLLKINPDDWKGIDYSIIIKNKLVADIERQEDRNSMIELFQTAVQFLQSGVLDQQEQERARKQVSQLFDQIIETYPEIEIDAGDTKTMNIEQELNKMRTGETVEVDKPEEAVRQAAGLAKRAKPERKQDIAKYMQELFAQQNGVV